mmetsp:Transcript_40821/g.68407  ORF Transcript_40821/g.68407 Transcript_40821/m.68407 type:complete len:107 (-) Transcript_40821:1902-2222(-)
MGALLDMEDDSLGCSAQSERQVKGEDRCAGIQLRSTAGHVSKWNTYIVKPELSIGLPAAAAGAFGSGISMTTASEVKNNLATEHAFSKQQRMTFVGSTTPVTMRSS